MNDVPYLFFKNVSFKYNNSLQNLVQPDISPWKIVLRTIAPYEIQIITPEQFPLGQRPHMKPPQIYCPLGLGYPDNYS